MRFDKLTIKAQEAIARAQQTAQQFNHAEITPLHLLGALLEESDGVFNPLLQKLGADPEQLRQIVGAELDRLPKATGTQTGPSRAGQVKGLAAGRHCCACRDRHGPCHRGFP